MLLRAEPIVHNPFVFQLGPLAVTGFGIAVLLGFFIGQIIGERELARRGHDPSPVTDVVFAAVLGFLVGAKIYYAILVGDWHAIFSRGGFVFWGGLIGGILGGAIAVRLRRVGFNHVADVAGPGIAAGYAVGRTGCWAVGDDYGRPWSGPLAVEFPHGAPPSTAANLHTQFGVSLPPGLAPDAVLAVHPTQLYETAMGLVMFLILWRLRDHEHAEGWLFGAYMVLAGVERFLVEFVRAKDDRFFGPLTTAQVLSVGFVIAGAAWMYWKRRPAPGAPGIHAGRAQAAAAAAAA